MFRQFLMRSISYGVAFGFCVGCASTVGVGSSKIDGSASSSVGVGSGVGVGSNVGANAQVYTIYSLPASFNTEAKARKQMTTIKVPVWKMTASGGRYASSMDLTINFEDLEHLLPSYSSMLL